MPDETIYAKPRQVDSLDQCDFYHSVDIPGHGPVAGEMDLRGRERAYLGGVAFAGKRVLEVGAASGYLTFHMESLGAEVVAYDLSEDFDWDVVPYARVDHRAILEQRKRGMRRVNDSFWICHRAFRSRARAVYGSVYAVPAGIGPVDITTFCTVLVHLHDPFLALRQALALTRETVVVTEFVWRPFWPALLASYISRPKQVFLPDFRRAALWDTWWFLSPAVVTEFLGVLGFETTRVSYHVQRYAGRRALCFTVVGERTRQRPMRHDA